MSVLRELKTVSSNLETSTRAGDFIALCRCVALSRPGHPAEAIAREVRASDRVQTVLKAGVTAGALEGWGSPLAEHSGIISAFFETLKNQSAFDRMLPDMRRVPFRSRVVLVTGGGTAAAVAEGSVKPITSLSFNGLTTDPHKAVALVIASEELFKFGAATDMFARELRNAVAVSTDSQFLSIITTGITPATSSGTTVAAVAADFKTAFDAIATGQASRLFAVTTSTIAKAWSTMADSGNASFPAMTPQGGTMFGIPVIVSDGVTAGEIIFVDAAALAAAAGTAEVDTASHTSIQFETTPDSPATDATVLRSLWQANERAVKVTRFFEVQRSRTDSVAVIDGAEYSGNSP